MTPSIPNSACRSVESDEVPMGCLSPWELAEKQAKQVKKLKTKEAKDRQVVLLCETLKRALAQ